MPLVWLQITSNWEQLLFQANLYFLLHAALSSVSHWHSKRPLALAPRCSAASKIITLKVGQRELEMERSACCASHIVRLLRLNLLTFISAAHLIWIQCFTEPSVFPSSAAVVFSVALIHHCNNKKKRKKKKKRVILVLTVTELKSFHINAALTVHSAPCQSKAQSGLSVDTLENLIFLARVPFTPDLTLLGAGCISSNVNVNCKDSGNCHTAPKVSVSGNLLRGEQDDKYWAT